MSVIKVNNGNMIHSSSPNKCITRTKMRVQIQFLNTAQILSGGSSVALVEVIFSLSPSSGQVIKLHSAQIIFPLHAIQICSRVFTTQVQVTGANQEGSLFRGSALCAPGCHAHPFKAPAVVVSFSLGVDGLCSAGVPSGSVSTFQAPLHSASFIQSGSAWRRTASAPLTFPRSALELEDK